MDYNQFSRDELIRLLEENDRETLETGSSIKRNRSFNDHDVLDFMPDEMIQINHDLIIIWANKRAYDSHPQILGKSCDEIFALSDSGSLIYTCGRAIKTGLNQRLISNLKDEESDKYVEINIIPVQNEKLGNVNLFITCRDATEGERNKIKLNEYDLELVSARTIAHTASQAKSDFLANTSHEIRTPMNGIMGMIQLLETTQLTDKQKEFIEYLRVSSSRLLGVVDNIIDISVLEQGQYNIIEEEFSVNDFMKDTFSSKEKLAVSKGISIDYKVTPKVPVKVIADKYRLSQILSNIIDNSIKFSKIGHIEIFLDAEVNENQGVDMLIRVTDTGIGIPEEKLETIFEEFNQVDNSSTREYNGTGLGLAITKRLVELMGGKIEVHSTYGVGTTFRLNIPMKVSEFELRKTREKLNVNHSDEIVLDDKKTYVPTILVAEDEMLGRITIKLMLKDKYNVIFAKNGKIATEKYLENEPDLVLMDIMMPIMNGFEAFDEIEKSVTTRAPIIACTAKVIKTEKEYLMSYGFDDYLSKPIDMKQLHSIIEKHLNKSDY